MCEYYLFPIVSAHRSLVILQVEELKSQTIQRGRLMCTCYPGGDKEGEDCGKGGPCRYIKHCDNPDRNGRILTTLYYLNKDWIPSHGGQLRIFPQNYDGSNARPSHDVAPLHDRFLIFFSDRRNPHEVTVPLFFCHPVSVRVKTEISFRYNFQSLIRTAHTRRMCHDNPAIIPFWSFERSRLFAANFQHQRLWYLHITATKLCGSFQRASRCRMTLQRLKL